jgi:hypothetical protein
MPMVWIIHITENERVYAEIVQRHVLCLKPRAQRHALAISLDLPPPEPDTPQELRKVGPEIHFSLVTDIVRRTLQASLTSLGKRRQQTFIIRPSSTPPLQKLPVMHQGMYGFIVRAGSVHQTVPTLVPLLPAFADRLDAAPPVLVVLPPMVPSYVCKML